MRTLEACILLIGEVLFENEYKHSDWNEWLLSPDGIDTIEKRMLERGWSFFIYLDKDEVRCDMYKFERNPISVVTSNKNESAIQAIAVALDVDRFFKF